MESVSPSTDLNAGFSSLHLSDCRSVSHSHEAAHQTSVDTDCVLSVLHALLGGCCGTYTDDKTQCLEGRSLELWRPYPELV